MHVNPKLQVHSPNTAVFTIQFSFSTPDYHVRASPRYDKVFVSQ